MSLSLTTQADHVDERLAAYERTLAWLPEHQRKYLPAPKTSVDAYLDPEFRSDACKGTEFTRALLQAIKLQRLMMAAAGSNSSGATY